MVILGANRFALPASLSLTDDSPLSPYDSHTRSNHGKMSPTNVLLSPRSSHPLTFTALPLRPLFIDYFIVVVSAETKLLPPCDIILNYAFNSSSTVRGGLTHTILFNNYIEIVKL